MKFYMGIEETSKDHNVKEETFYFNLGQKYDTKITHVILLSIVLFVKTVLPLHYASSVGKCIMNQFIC